MKFSRPCIRRSTALSRRCLSALACLFAAFWFTGCSTFERNWRAAEQTLERHDDLTGRWEGTWRSEVNGHNDQLRCLMTPLTNGLHAARFHAKYKKGIFRFSFGYSVPLQVRRANDVFRFEGEADLGWLAGGIYRCKGSATATNFFSTYRSKYDHGTFQMTRPAQTP
jgi:hypothetical protein